MLPLAAGLIGLGMGLLFFAFLGWFGSANRFNPSDRKRASPTSVADRRRELAPMAAEAYTSLFLRLRRPLVAGGVLACMSGVALLVQRAP